LLSTTLKSLAAICKCKATFTQRAQLRTISVIVGPSRLHKNTLKKREGSQAESRLNPTWSMNGSAL
jgi:hypothetical protein